MRSNCGAGADAFSAAIYDPFSTAAGPNNTFTRQPFPGQPHPAIELERFLVETGAGNLSRSESDGQASYPPRITSTQPVTRDGNQWNVRVDHQFGQHDSFFVRYTGANNPTTGVSLPSLPGSSQDKLTNVGVSDTHIFSPHFIVTGRYGLIGVDFRTGNTAPAGIADATGLSAVFPKFQGTDFLPQITIPGYSGVNFNASQSGPMHQQSWTGDAQKIAGEHTIEFGGSVVHSHMTLEDTTSTAVQFANLQTSNFTSSTGNPFASYLLGTPDSARRQIGGTLGDLTSTGYGMYVQDTWRIQRFTVNIGLRYDYNSPPINKYGLGTFDFNSGQYVWDLKNPITGAPANVRRGGIAPDRNNFAPRLGIAYAATSRLVVRSSFGLFYNSFGSNYIQASQSARGNWPFAFPRRYPDSMPQPSMRFFLIRFRETRRDRPRRSFARSV